MNRNNNEILEQGNGLSRPILVVIGTGTSHKIVTLRSILGNQFDCVSMKNKEDVERLGKIEAHIHACAEHECLQPLVALSKALFIPDVAPIKIAGDVAMYGGQHKELKPWHQPGSFEELRKQAIQNFSLAAATELGPDGNALIPIRCQLSLAILSQCAHLPLSHIDVVVEKKRLLLKPFSPQEIEEYLNAHGAMAKKSNGGFLIQTPEMQSRVAFVTDEITGEMKPSTPESIAKIQQLLLGAPSAEKVLPLLQKTLHAQPHAVLSTSIEYLTNFLDSTGLKQTFGNPAPTMFQIHNQRVLKRRFA